MTISVDIRLKRGQFLLDAKFTSSGRLTALFGASGSGKSTLVDAIAGLVRPADGRIIIDGRTLVDTESGIFVPKHRRCIGYVFQDARMFPHLSVKHNLGYGRWFARPAAASSIDMQGVITLLGIENLLDRRPTTLSGGEKQRVAIGRALLANPALLLMDEPLASLDEQRKAEIMPYLERLRDEAKIPIVYVSHSVVEVARLATDVIVLSDGKVVASGSTSEIMQQLDFLPAGEQGEGGSVLDVIVESHDERFAMTLLRSKAGHIRVPAIATPVGGMERVRIRARDVLIATIRPSGISALNVLPGTIRSMRQVDQSQVDISVDCAGDVIVSRITNQSAFGLGLAPGSDVFAIVKSVSLHRSGLL